MRQIRQVTHSLGHRIFSIVRFLMLTVTLAVIFYVAFALVVSTDTERVLHKENRMYARHYADLQRKYQMVEDEIAILEARDNEIYQAIFHTGAPDKGLIPRDEFLAGVDTVPDSYVVKYASKKLKTLEQRAGRTEENLRKMNEIISQKGVKLPPLSLPLARFSYAQTGASVGEKMNPFFNVKSMHTGLDIIAPQGDPVLAAADGVVSDVIHSGKGQGRTVEITHPNGYKTRYAHLSEIFVSRGQTVRRGTRIATVGFSGQAFVPHLHYEVLRDTTYVDPLNYLFASLSPQEYVAVEYISENTGQSMD